MDIDATYECSYACWELAYRLRLIMLGNYSQYLRLLMLPCPFAELSGYNNSVPAKLKRSPR